MRQCKMLQILLVLTMAGVSVAAHDHYWNADTLTNGFWGLNDALAAGKNARVIYLSPQGRALTQTAVKALAQQPGLILIAGRYEGIDERIIEQEVDEEWSIGDYVLSGGELAALVMIDAVARMIPGVLGDDDSAAQDSFMEGILDCPHYTRPEEIDGRRVPQVLLGGNHKAIDEWRMKQALGRTWLRRPELLNELTLSNEQQQLLREFQEEYQQRLDTGYKSEQDNE